MLYTLPRMENFVTQEALIKKREELLQDIQFVDKNLLGVSSLIIKEISSLEVLKNGINLYKIESLKIDRKNNCAQISDLQTFERQLTHAVSERVEEISVKSNFIKHLTEEHTRIQGIKKELEEELSSLPLVVPTTKTPVKEPKATQLSFILDSKK